MIVGAAHCISIPLRRISTSCCCWPLVHIGTIAFFSRCWTSTRKVYTMHAISFKLFCFKEELGLLPKKCNGHYNNLRCKHPRKSFSSRLTFFYTHGHNIDRICARFFSFTCLRQRVFLVAHVFISDFLPFI